MTAIFNINRTNNCANSLWEGIIIELLAAVAAAFLAGLIKTTFGVGAGVFLTPLLALILNPLYAVGIMAPLMLSTDITTIGFHWKKWDMTLLKGLIPSLILGVFVGVYYLSWASPIVVKITIGLIAMFFSSFQIIRMKNPEYFSKIELKPIHGKFISFTAGITSAIAHAGGIVISIYLLAGGFKKREFVATLTAFLLISDIFKMILFTHFGILTIPIVIDSFKLIPGLFLGSWLGSKLITKLTDSQFVIIVNILIFVAGLILIFR